MSEPIAKFRFQDYRIVESTIKIDEEKEVSQNLDVEFNKTVGVDEGEQKMRLELSTSITDKNNALSIKVKAFGFFIFDKALPEEAQKTFFDVNAPAILFPYVRAYISTLTSLSGMKPIILPTLNLSKR